MGTTVSHENLFVKGDLQSTAEVEMDFLFQERWYSFDLILFWTNLRLNPSDRKDTMNGPRGNTILIPLCLIGVFTVLFLT